ncbi:MAG: cytochrome b N-terminal domain-containing protein [Anaerolineales bacterium]|nr:cytochrome b N-terminal domain-containing protein [Anaerolineales bacterium]
MRPNFFHHLHPPTIPAPQARLRYTLGAGGLAVFFTLVTGVTGALEMFYYVPTPEGAGLSIQQLTFLVPFGGLVRNLHYWSAQLLVIFSALHLLRVVFTAAYGRPRRFNYLLGLGLLVLVLLFDFTGYGLRWDEGVRWALVTGTNLVRSIPLLGAPLYALIVGSEQPGAAMLTRFYAWHIFGLTLLLAILGVWHLFRVRRDGGIAVPPPELRTDPERITRFELVRREVLAMLVGGALLLLLAIFIPAPLAAPIGDMNAPGGEPRAPWFFLWVQQMLAWGSPFLFGVLIPLGILLLLALIPYALPNPKPAELGRWFPASGRAAQIIAVILTLLVLGLTLARASAGQP